MDDLHLTDPEARTLFGYPARTEIRCLGCGQNAEPFESVFCWLCCTTGQRTLVEAILPGRYLKRAERTGDTGC